MIKVLYCLQVGSNHRPSGITPVTLPNDIHRIYIYMYIYYITNTRNNKSYNKAGPHTDQHGQWQTFTARKHSEDTKSQKYKLS